MRWQERAIKGRLKKLCMPLIAFFIPLSALLTPLF
jgi:hypothetical protein